MFETVVGSDSDGTDEFFVGLDASLADNIDETLPLGHLLEIRHSGATCAHCNDRFGSDADHWLHRPA